jgi:hypothetical protein
MIRHPPIVVARGHWIGLPELFRRAIGTNGTDNVRTGLQWTGMGVEADGEGAFRRAHDSQGPSRRRQAEHGGNASFRPDAYK